MYRKTANNPTTGQENPLLFTPIEEADIDKNTNRFTSASGTTYNEAGQVITDNKFRLMSFGYDANGRMVKAARENQPDALSVYDSLGNRVATKTNDVWQFVIYDAFGKLIAEYGGLQSSDEGGVRYILSDWQGSIRCVLNNSGFVQSRTDYQAFGEEIQAGIGLRTTAQGFGVSNQTRQGYGLTEKDETGLNHTWYRKNENRAGRWTSPDPYNGSISIGNPQTFNRYSYVENEPTNFVDPSGLQQTSFIFCEPNRWDPSTATLYVGRCFQYLSGSQINLNINIQNVVELGGGEGNQTSETFCYPSAKQLIKNRTVLDHLQQAWIDSQPGTDEAHEEGGWIYANKDGFIYVIRAPRGQARSIDLSNPPVPTPFPGMSPLVLVAIFHTHPNYGKNYRQRHSPDDIDLANARNIPDIVRARNGIFLTGPKRRGSNPKNAVNPGEIIAGYPGNSENTKNCK